MELKIFLLIFLIMINSSIGDNNQCIQECSKNANCQEFNNNNEYCCKCSAGFIGNGVNCLVQDDTIFLRGKLNGILNNIKLDDLDVNAFVQTQSSDARNYAAIRQIPKQLGKRITQILTFSTPINWLFAGSSSSNTLNGFMLTGGVFTRQSDSTFFNEQGDNIGNLFLNQNFTGINENFKELMFNTFIDGNLPEMSNDDEQQVIYPDYDEKYEYKSNLENSETRKMIEISSSIIYYLASKNNPNNLKKRFRIEHNERIHFTVCKALNEEQLMSNEASVKLMTKRLTVEYTENDSQLKFSSANFVSALNSEEKNPCESNDCSIYAECVIAPEEEKGYSCLCKRGFEEDDDKKCQDINECDESTYCSVNAECKNWLGFYECICRQSYVGDGRSCELESEKEQDNICTRCHRDASCLENSDGKSACVCNEGFTGNGFQCDLAPVRDRNPTTAATTTRLRLEHKDKCQDCHVFATCETQQETDGECCKCIEGYIGNGKYCIQEATPIYVTGKVSGTLNNENLNDLDLYAYVLTHSSDSRNFVAIGKIPVNLGGSFQVLINLINPINWLFSGRNGLDENVKISNGFSMTGGLFSRVSAINFYDESLSQSNSVTIKQEYLGLDSESKDLMVKTEIDGTIPNIDVDAQVIFRDYKQEYTRYSKGLIKSNGELTYEVTSTRNSQSFRQYRIDYSDTFTFVECPHLNEPSSSTYRVNSKRVFIRYTKGDSLVKFSSANYIYPSEMADDPCESNLCSIYAECVADPEVPANYSCVCKVGFEGDGYTCLDVDECESGESNCDPNAACYNYIGHHECNCKTPYVGNGIECSFELNCNSCDLNSDCIDLDGQKKCVCKSGYFGDGFICRLDTSNCDCAENAECLSNYETGRQECKCRMGFSGDGSSSCVPLPCNEFSNCNQNARCVLNNRGNYECQCSEGFFGDGYKCSSQSCDIVNNCAENAQCIPDSTNLQYSCVCNQGFLGNGYTCVKDVQTCELLKNCHQFAECLFDDRINRHSCRCKPGFTGDGFYCTAINSCRDRSINNCDVNADCIYETKLKDHICKCKPGFEGNGLISKCYIDESYGLYLIYAQGASLHKISFKTNTINEKESSPHKNRIVHIPGQTSVAVAYDCHEQYIYWSDVSTNVINKIRADGSDFSVVLNNVKSAEGLAVDWISRNLYFTDSEAKTIEVASLNGLHRKVIVKSNLNNPRGIAIDPIDGYIFWTDWNRKHPKIERANMDGTNRKVIVQNDLGVPNGIYFDQKRQEICWCDAKTQRIECVEKDGSSRRVITQLTQIYPFDLTEVKSTIYWSDWSRKEIQTIDKSGVIGQPIKLSLGGSGRIYGVHAVRNTCSKGTNACERLNGGCSQLCLPRPDFTYQCACSDDANSSECTKSRS